MLLDWEGVLADTGQARRDSMLGALADEGVRFDATAYDEYCLGLSVQEAAAAAVGAADPTLLELVAVRARRAFATRVAQGFALQPGAARLLELAQLRAPVAIVTEARRSETESALRLAGFLDSCAAIVTADEVRGDAPSPAQFELALAQLGRRRRVRGGRVVALVSTRAAIRAAREAGVHTVAVGVPAHVALDADGAIGSLLGVALDELAALAGISSERPA
ncbi:MAG TPA: HAD hydrolase-like protein [Gemmatimonadaceae bacterium]|nr:HAD hydrolase-like protein [Gemmatimonadaceae bacterium]